MDDKRYEERNDKRVFAERVKLTNEFQQSVPNCVALLTSI